jgi:hypothetical protein
MFPLDTPPSVVDLYPHTPKQREREEHKKSLKLGLAWPCLVWCVSVFSLPLSLFLSVSALLSALCPPL